MSADRLALLRAAHAKLLARRAAEAKREHAADRFVRTIAPHLCGDDTPHAVDPDALDEITPTTVRLREVSHG